MSSHKQSPVWIAEPHTIAKIKILETYLNAWLPILGSKRKGQDLLYVDGFAGPGEYSNFSDASPIVACRAATKTSTSDNWCAGLINCVFIEPDIAAFTHLKERLQVFDSNRRLHIHLINSSFDEGIDQIKELFPKSFQGSHPLFVFIDPFGAKGAEFRHVAEILRGDTSEVLINFDADGIGRIFRAGKHANAERLLTSIYGDYSWKLLEVHSNFDLLCREALNLYKSSLKSLPKVKYVFAFEMRSKSGLLNYFLVFASKHPLGLTKMKEAMRSLDQNGGYLFSDAHVDQPSLFRWDDPDEYASKMHDIFKGKIVSYAETSDFALNETPFVNPKSMLRILESKGLINVVSNDSKRRRGNFPEEKIVSIQFRFDK